MDRVVLVLDGLRLDPEPLLEEVAEQLGVPFLNPIAARFLPQVLGEAGAVEIVVAGRHQQGQIAGEILRVEVVLREDEPEVLLAQGSRATGLQQGRGPERMALLERAERVERFF